MLVVAAGVAASASAAPTPRTFDVDVSRDPVGGGGEPWVAVSTRDPRNLVFAWLSSSVGLGQRPPEPTTDPGKVGPSLAHCGVAYSTDRGVTWRKANLPVTDLVYHVCGDPFVVAGRRGAFY